VIEAQLLSLVAVRLGPETASGVQDTAAQTSAPAGPASGSPAGPTPAPAANPLTSFAMPLVLCAVVFYLLVLGPERKQRKKRDEMLKNIAKGDKVMTTGGLHATVAGIQDDVITLLIADGVRVRFARSAVQTVVVEESPEPEKAERPERIGEKVVEKGFAKR
jgi:preprotein translocase subunit YajC